MSGTSFLWHDYETFGTHPALDRPAQFAALRTDAQLQELGEPLSIFCKPASDMLPHPGACLVTRITPQRAASAGCIEAEFAQAIHAQMMEPGSCCVGYNSLRFDDEFTRHLFYRNFYDPYEREYRNGNSRFDLIDLARMCFALRPQGVQWPEHEAGIPSFRLEELTAANGIDHSGAHDALADVRATIALARRLRLAQPRLWDWGLSMREQKAAIRLLDTGDPKPLVHTSSRYPASRGCTTLVLALAKVPDRPKSVIVIDLMFDPQALLDLDADAIADRLFTPAADLPEDVERIPLKAVHSNKVPMLAPQAVLQDVDTARIGLDPQRCARHAERLRPHLAELRSRLMEVFAPPPPDLLGDPETRLYSGGFLPDADRALMRQIPGASPELLAKQSWPFKDARLKELLFRYRARNYPDSLDAAETQRWEHERRQRLLKPRTPAQLSFAQFHDELAEARRTHVGDGRAQALLDALQAWAEALHLDPQMI